MSKQILLIDDNHIDNFVSRTILIQSGFNGQIIEYQSASQALDYLSHALSQSTISVVILLDISMPEMDGFEFLNEFLKLPNIVRQNSKIVMLSSTVAPNDIKRCKENPLVVKLLSKPLKVDELSLNQLFV